MRGIFALRACSQRLTGAQGRVLRALTHPLSAALLGVVTMAPDGLLAALLGGLLAAAVAWWAWAAQGQADRAGAALLGAASRLIEASPSWRRLHALAAVWPPARERDAHADRQAALAYERLGAPHLGLTPRLTPTPSLTRASG